MELEIIKDLMKSVILIAKQQHDIIKLVAANLPNLTEDQRNDLLSSSEENSKTLESIFRSLLD